MENFSVNTQITEWVNPFVTTQIAINLSENEKNKIDKKDKIKIKIKRKLNKNYILKRRKKFCNYELISL